MSLMRRDPFEMATPLRDVMSRLFEESFLWPERLGERFGVSTMRALPLDLRESDDRKQYILEADVAGFKPEEIQVTSSDDTITIHAAKQGETRAEQTGYIRQERYVGEVNRTVTLPSSIDADKIQATCEQGVLTLRIPKTEGTGLKQISVKAAGH